jgi:hypothetical protein
MGLTSNRDLALDFDQAFTGTYRTFIVNGHLQVTGLGDFKGSGAGLFGTANNLVVGRATNANNLDSTVTGGARINGNNVVLSNLGSNAGTVLVRDSNNNLKLQSSSLRYKENIVEAVMDPSWIFDENMNPKFFNYIGSNEPQIGLVAEEVNEVDAIKDIVLKNSEGEPESIMYDRIAVLLVPIIRNQQIIISDLENRIKYLEEVIEERP